MNKEQVEKYIAMMDYHGRGEIARRNIEILERYKSGETFRAIGAKFGISAGQASEASKAVVRNVNRYAGGEMRIGVPLGKDDDLRSRGELPTRARHAFSHFYPDGLTVANFCVTPLKDLYRIPNLGKKSVGGIIEFIEGHGFSHVEKVEVKSYSLPALRQVQTIISNLGLRVVDANGREVRLEDVKGVALREIMW